MSISITMYVVISKSQAGAFGKLKLLIDSAEKLVSEKLGEKGGLNYSHHFSSIFENNENFTLCYDVLGSAFTENKDCQEEYFFVAEEFSKILKPDMLLISELENGGLANSYFEYHEDVHLFCLEDFADKITREKVRKLISRGEIIEIIREHSPDGFFETREGVAVFSKPNRPGQLHPRFYLRLVLRRRGLKLVGITEAELLDYDSGKFSSRVEARTSITSGEKKEIENLVASERKRLGVKFLTVPEGAWRDFPGRRIFPPM